MFQLLGQKLMKRFLFTKLSNPSAILAKASKFNL